jgi:hypothetical protein
MIGHGALREMFPHAQRDLDVFAVALRLDTADIHDGRGVVLSENQPLQSELLQTQLAISAFLRGLSLLASTLRSFGAARWLQPCRGHALRRSYFPSGLPATVHRASDIGRSASPAPGTSSRSAFGLRNAG